jgi:hypothetical protein
MGIINWLKKILGIKTPLERKRHAIAVLQEKAFKAQRNGDLSLAGVYLLEAEILETEIFELTEDNI